MESLELRKPARASGDAWVTSAGRCQGELGPGFAGGFLGAWYCQSYLRPGSLLRPLEPAGFRVSGVRGIGGGEWLNSCEPGAVDDTGAMEPADARVSWELSVMDATWCSGSHLGP